MNASETAAAAEPAVRITPMENGPTLVRGSVHLVGADGREIPHQDPFALCRCGASGNKPFCDGSHKRIGFQAPGAKTAAQ